VADRVHRGHNAPSDHKFEVYYTTSLARSAASPRPSNATCAAFRRPSRSTATPRPNTAQAALTSPARPATPPKPSSPAPATTSAACSPVVRSPRRARRSHRSRVSRRRGVQSSTRPRRMCECVL
jgi:hypothetical protein